MPTETCGTRGGHFIVQCRNCHTVISQCRCPSLQKTIRYERCDACRTKQVAPAPKGDADPYAELMACSRAMLELVRELKTHQAAVEALHARHEQIKARIDALMAQIDVIEAAEVGDLPHA